MPRERRLREYGRQEARRREHVLIPSSNISIGRLPLRSIASTKYAPIIWRTAALMRDGNSRALRRDTMLYRRWRHHQRLRENRRAAYALSQCFAIDKPPSGGLSLMAGDMLIRRRSRALPSRKHHIFIRLFHVRVGMASYADM